MNINPSKTAGVCRGLWQSRDSRNSGAQLSTHFNAAASDWRNLNLLPFCHEIQACGFLGQVLVLMSGDDFRKNQDCWVMRPKATLAPEADLKESQR